MTFRDYQLIDCFVEYIDITAIDCSWSTQENNKIIFLYKYFARSTSCSNVPSGQLNDCS